MDASQLSKLSYVSRHVDELFEQRVEQFDSLYDSQVNWLQEFVQGKEANLKEQLEYPFDGVDLSGRFQPRPILRVSFESLLQISFHYY